MKQAMTPEEIKEKKPYLDWSLSEHEYDYICDHLLHRLPNYTEIGLFSAMWSEHCSYKKSKPVLKLFPTKGKRVVQGPGEGAGGGLFHLADRRRRGGEIAAGAL